MSTLSTISLVRPASRPSGLRRQDNAVNADSRQQQCRPSERANAAGAHLLNYAASKGAPIGMARTLAVGLGSDGVAVTAVAPGLTRTPATVVVPAAEFADTEAHQALPRPLNPDDTAAVVAMLARDEAAALTGQTLTVDGGLVMR
jgi:NAD(P)-dependent dehydrogenase (short-subunit alcohol dehydrogenase family)